MMTVQYGDCSLDDPQVRAVLERLHRSAEESWRRIRRRRGVRLAGALARRLLGRKLFVAVRARRPFAAARPRRLEDLAPPISREQGTLAYLVARSIGARRIVEFGTGFGVSTIYLAAAVKDNGGGLLIGSEIVETKAVKAQAHLEEAGLADCVDIRLGDAQETLADPGGVVDMVLLDGSKDLYLSILKMLIPHLGPGAVVLADNINTHKEALTPYLTYMCDARNGFQSVTVPFRGGFEYSVRLAAPVRSEEHT